jgi:hypothetical protein
MIMKLSDYFPNYLINVLLQLVRQLKFVGLAGYRACPVNEKRSPAEVPL